MDELQEFEALPLRAAYVFLTGKNLSEEANQIRLSKDTYGSYHSTLKRGKILALLEKNNLLPEFLDSVWQFGKTEKGKTRLQRYQRIYDSFIGQQGTEEEEEEDNAEEAAFAYEENLRDYLVRNLHKIELGMTLFNDGKGKKGVEYPVDMDGRRIDILALDSHKIPVIIELKVSKGHERVIGQALYYRGKVKELLGSEQARIVIVAQEITPELKIATKDLTDCKLFEYKIAFNLKEV